MLSQWTAVLKVRSEGVKHRKQKISDINPPWHILKNDSLENVFEVVAEEVDPRISESIHMLTHQSG